MNNDENSSAEDEEDKCTYFIGSYVVKTLRVKWDKWLKFMRADEYKALLREWLCNSNARLLLITASANGDLIGSLSIPSARKTKCCYFIKAQPSVLTAANIKNSILCGDFSPNALNDLGVLLNEIWYPLLANTLNQQSWPSEMVRDIDTHVQKMRNTIAEIGGSIINQTILPMPITIDRIMEIGPQIAAGDTEIDGIYRNLKVCDVKVRNSVEGIVIKWGHQINDVLCEMPGGGHRQQQQRQQQQQHNSRHLVPAVEFGYWNSRYSNLSSIYRQLRDAKVKMIGSILEALDSAYFTTFMTTFKGVVTALHESRDIRMYLNAFSKSTAAWETSEFFHVKSLISPTLHCLTLVWMNSTYFCTQERITRILRMLCNLLINLATKELDSSSLFLNDADEGLSKLEQTIDILEHFKQQVLVYREKINEHQTCNKFPVGWTFSSSNVFDRLNGYLNRLNDIRQIFITAIEFAKLERIEIGGLKGRSLSRRIAEKYESFQKLYIKWTFIQFDPLDVDPLCKSFTKERIKFTKQTEILERALAKDMFEAFDDCNSTEHCIKLIEMTGTLLNRPIIAMEIQDKYKLVVECYRQDMNLARISFEMGIRDYDNRGLHGLPLDRGYPPAVTGVLQWINMIRERIEKPLKDMPFLELPVFENEDGRNVLMDKQKLLMALLDFERTVFVKWCEQCPAVISSTLNDFLFIRGKDASVIQPNFRLELMEILREIKYVKSIGFENVPTEANELFKLMESLWNARIMVSRVAECYNFIHKGMHPCEIGLIANAIAELDAALALCTNEAKWSNYDVQLLERMYHTAKDVYERVQRAQSHVQQIVASVHEWGDRPLYERKDRSPTKMLNIDERDGRLLKRRSDVINTNNLIKRVMDENLKLFFIHSNEIGTHPNAVDQQKQSFSNYEQYIDQIIAHEIINSICQSLRYIETEMGATNSLKIHHPTKGGVEEHRRGIHPLFGIKFMLHESQLQFAPPLTGDSQTGGLIYLIEQLMDDACSIVDLMPTVSQTTGHQDTYQFENNIKLATYRSYLNVNIEIDGIRASILRCVQKTCRETVEYVKKYEAYNYLWLDDRQVYLENFIKYGPNWSSQLQPHKLGERDDITACIADESMMSGGGGGGGDDDCAVTSSAPSLEAFKEQIDHFSNLHEEVEDFEETLQFHNWLLVDFRDFKYAVLNEIGKWGNLFKQHLVRHVICTLNELEQFINEGEHILALEIVAEDFDRLLMIMAVLNQIKERHTERVLVFEPLRDIVDTLKLYSVDFSAAIYKQFSDLPEKWHQLEKRAQNVKDAMAPLRVRQINVISRRIALFDIRINLFRRTFTEMMFFNVPCENVYELCDTVHWKLVTAETEMGELEHLACLFELTKPDTLNLTRRCRKELKLVKQLWDFVNVVDSSIESWRLTPWKQIEAEAIEQACKQFSKEMRQIDKGARQWTPYLYVEKALKNLVTSLRAITELQNVAIRDRHWIELMHATGISIRLDERTIFADLLNLNLHLHEEEVKNVVDKAVKEEGMEKTLTEINDTWSAMQFEYGRHERTGLQMLKVSEELIEILEENQVHLQTMASSKYIAYFEMEINKWVQQLGSADCIINAWMEAQRKWIYLESIFVGTEDIRNQLPCDSKRFDALDVQFKSVLDDMLLTPNVIQVTSQLHMHARIEVILDGFAMCEKALNDYLDTKRIAYPRFYFVSSADLLDILSHGNQPMAVCRHLAKLYDSIMKLEFSNGGGSNKLAMGMYAKQNDEYIAFGSGCDCGGKVEIWLNHVTDAMRATLRMHLRRAIQAYDNQPREDWVLDWAAQPALVTTQIYWTLEVSRAFGKLEIGHEHSLKDYQKKQVGQLNALIMLLLGDLSPANRQKIMTICTIDVHSRDVVTKLIGQRIETGLDFQWQCQLRHRWDETAALGGVFGSGGDCFANICDAQFKYDYEYLGNTPRLVITPLTDRCYITLTQSLHLVMGGAPAGPAGTGKTETTKDLGKGLGIMVYVFNCSEQMDFKSCGNIYKGLAQTGAWGCFDEFNRISIEVLSVVAVQVKCIQDAIKTKKTTFNFVGEHIHLVPTVGIFITMNPGYAGRTELPENLKALFRPCAMVVPDFALICEIMLVAEGFQEARTLARKCITLYTLCRELLSKQDHYDWGLRAIKSVLLVAGALRRADRQMAEDLVLMRALRDFNTPKIVTEDTPIFIGLIGDLFPLLHVARKRSTDFEKLIRKSALELRLQPENEFVLKVVQLEELFAVRHSVFIVGNAGTGKSEVWKTLHRTYFNANRKPVYNDINPKSVTNNELFGVINPTTREWKDGLLSMIMREQASIGDCGPKWIVLDGDIDPMWIESLNTLMDDNKVLTLASNERIALTAEMRLLFEIGHLRTATPATVSRAGILYINPQDLGWNLFVSSWLVTRSANASEQGILALLFDRYVPVLMEHRKKFKTITPISDIATIQMTCHLLECLLTPENVPPPCDTAKECYEMYFVFAVIWGFGSALYQDQLVDWRNEFSKFWLHEFRAIKFPSTPVPSECNVFDYFVEPCAKKWSPWSALMVSPIEFDCDTPLQAALIPTADTICLRYFLDTLMGRQHPVMLVGGSGCGKSVIMANKLQQLPENYAITSIPFNFYTTSEILQKILEKPLEKKSGKNFGPPGNKAMIYFVDDMNMPEVDAYGTVQPHQIIRQFMDYRHWYDRTKLSVRNIYNCQFTSCMNPTAGALTIDARLQRHFSTFAVGLPSDDLQFHIYNTILSQHLSSPLNNFPSATQKMCSSLVQMGLALHSKVAQSFLPTAVKFHYTFNLRDLANIFQGMLFANKDSCPEAPDLIRLYMHEASRVYGDKLVDEKDQDLFQKFLIEIVKREIEDVDESKLFEAPLIYCHFADGLGDAKYMPAKSWQSISDVLHEAQASYNESVGHSSLVLFDDAIAHVCRINKIVESPRGNALLVGVGGSGKQSLARLAAFMSSLSVNQIQLKRGYTVVDMKHYFNMLYMKVGVKNVMSLFLMTDSQVADEGFLVLINDILATGEIPELFADDDIDSIINAVRNEVKQNGTQDTKENCWKYFIAKVRRMLKIVLCFSPVGSALRIRARKFPALVNCTSIDWFHEWPKVALESVSLQFVAEIQSLPPDIVEPVSSFMAFVHGTVNEVSQIYLANEKRYNYTTPKSFLELIALYSKLVDEKTMEINQRIMRLENGLVKLAQCAEQVDTLQMQLVEQEVALKAKNEAADKLIVIVGAENERVQKEKNFAAAEERKVRIIEEDVSIKAKLCEEDLRKAEPALLAAQDALNTLNKNNLTELKSFGSPPQAVVNVCAAVMVLFTPRGKLPRDRTWRAAKQMMSSIDKFLHDLVHFDKEHIAPKVIDALQVYLKNSEFNPDKIRIKSVAAAGLCEWVININKFYQVYLIVGPKQRALKDAQHELKAAQSIMQSLNVEINELEHKMSTINGEFKAAVGEKQKLKTEAEKTAMKIDLAHRLVGGLASESVRWKESVESLKQQITTLPGDLLLISCFLSYVGCFPRGYRIDLQEKRWKPTFKSIKPEIPHTEGVNSLDLICDDAQIAQWNNEGLPSDRMSIENAIILTRCARWPLMIDPQLQGIKWIKQKYGKRLVVVRLTQKGYLDVIEQAVSSGDTVLLENIGERIDAVLDPLLSRALIKRGLYIKIGDKEVDYHPNFRLILQTKLANPHYKPEMQAQTTIINFTVTPDGLEDQLLAEVVKAERPDLEQLKTDLTIEQNTFKITLKHLEDDILIRLASAGEDVLDDPTLVVNLERTKKTAADIKLKVIEGKKASKEIDVTRECYRAAAERASLLYFILNDLFKINPMYQFSLKAFVSLFRKAIDNASKACNLKERITHLVDSITYRVFLYTCRGLFERDKLIFTAQMVTQIQLAANEITLQELDFLLRYAVRPNTVSPFEFLSHNSWGGIKALSYLDEFRTLDMDIECSPKRWKQYVEYETPEVEQFPGEWKHRTPFQKLCIIRCLRPDRMTYAIRRYVSAVMGGKYATARSIPLSESLMETNSGTPIFFILSPGVDPLQYVEAMGKRMQYSSDLGNFHNISLGQGQETVAEQAMQLASVQGHWVILQNIHLVAKWLTKLENTLANESVVCHENYRLFISAEPAAATEFHIIPQGILESAIKITNEPPTGMQANLHKTLDNFTQETMEMCSKEAEFKSILFALCYFHSVVAERRKFGPQGWNRTYPFNIGDLTISVYVLFNYLEANKGVPWEDLRYLFGEIMYGGHITDDWDRRLCYTYLEEIMQPTLLDGDLYLCKGFPAPPNTDYASYHQYVDEMLPPESPHLYGLHPNAEIGFLTSLSEHVFRTVLELQPRGANTIDGGGISREETLKIMIEDFQDKLPDKFDTAAMITRIEDRTPFITVAFQECERMNLLLAEMRKSLKTLLLGLRGELTITADMEALDTALMLDTVPLSWERLAYPSMAGLQAWFVDLMRRQRELEAWTSDFIIPASVWLAGLFNPQSFLTAIMQKTARKNEWPLDKMCLSVEVTRKWKENVTEPPKEGVNINGLFMEGARWDTAINSIAPSHLKELFPIMPVIYIRAITQDKQETKNIYECPVYRTRLRGPTYIWTFNLRTRERPSKWILGSVALLLQT